MDDFDLEFGINEGTNKVFIIPNDDSPQSSKNKELKNILKLYTEKEIKEAQKQNNEEKKDLEEKTKFNVKIEEDQQNS